MSGKRRSFETAYGNATTKGDTTATVSRGSAAAAHADKRRRLVGEHAVNSPNRSGETLTTRFADSQQAPPADIGHEVSTPSAMDEHRDGHPPDYEEHLPFEENADAYMPFENFETAPTAPPLTARFLSRGIDHRDPWSPYFSGGRSFRADRERVQLAAQLAAYNKAGAEASASTSELGTWQAKPAPDGKFARKEPQSQNVVQANQIRMAHMHNLRDVPDLIDMVRSERDRANADRRNPKGHQKAKRLSWELHMLNQQAEVLRNLGAADRKPGLPDLMKSKVTKPFAFKMSVPVKLRNSARGQREVDMAIIRKAFDLETYAGISECIEWLKYQLDQLCKSPLQYQPNERYHQGVSFFLWDTGKLFEESCNLLYTVEPDLPVEALIAKKAAPAATPKAIERASDHGESIPEIADDASFDIRSPCYSPLSVASASCSEAGSLSLSKDGEDSNSYADALEGVDKFPDENDPHAAEHPAPNEDSSTRTRPQTPQAPVGDNSRQGAAMSRMSAAGGVERPDEGAGRYRQSDHAVNARPDSGADAASNLTAREEGEVAADAEKIESFDVGRDDTRSKVLAGDSDAEIVQEADEPDDNGKENKVSLTKSFGGPEEVDDKGEESDLEEDEVRE